MDVSSDVFPVADPGTSPSLPPLLRMADMTTIGSTFSGYGGGKCCTKRWQDMVWHSCQGHPRGITHHTCPCGAVLVAKK